VSQLLITCRPKQWIKNFIIFLPLLFSFNEYWFFENENQAFNLLLKVTVSFVIFTLVSSSVYLVNDVVDAQEDRSHAVKKERPVASGILSARFAIFSSVFIASSGLFMSWILVRDLTLILAIYLGLMLCYTFLFRRFVILDVFCIALGFMLRVIAGGVVIGVPISPWLFVCMGFGALFIGFSKRKGELLGVSSMPYGESKLRGTLEKYDLGFIDSLLSMTLAATLISYCLYTFWAENLPENNAMMLTIPFVAYGLFRYLYLSKFPGVAERPEETIVRDPHMITSVILWLLAVVGILSLYR
jgi:4-hydroxybenzoate polyprenyltransferase